MTVTVTSKGQVTLPSEARRRLGIRAGTKLIESSCTPISRGRPSTATRPAPLTLPIT